MRGLDIRIKFVQAGFVGNPAADDPYGPWVAVDDAYARGIMFR